MSEKKAEKKKPSHTTVLAVGFVIAFILLGIFVILDYALWGVCIGSSVVIITIAIALMNTGRRGV